MLFSSLTFIFGFIPILMLLYFVSRNIKLKNFILLIFSLIFYAWGEPKYIFLMIITVFVVYIFGILIDKYDIKTCFFKKKFCFILCVIFVVGSLLFFKYYNFIIFNFNSIFKSNIKTINAILPIGISFYTFQILSYIIDLYNKKIKVQKSFFRLLLYVSFFPQLIAGPIVRYETIEDEILNRKTNIDDIIKGTKRFIVGLSKKVIIANNMAILADAIFNNVGNSYGTFIIWIAAVSYLFQIYFDFSGYSDMAIGLGQIFGFHFLENFNYPYISTSITDFWRRWHISLSSWFKDYVYIPLGGNRNGMLKQVRNILIVWCLTGLWHGASWNFILWGLYYAMFLLLEKFILKKILIKLPKAICWLYTMLIVIIGWVIFRVENLNDILNVISKMFVYQKTSWLDIISSNISIYVSIIYIILAVVFSFPIFDVINKKFSTKKVYNIVVNIILIGLLIIDVTFLTSSNYNPFIYFRF